MLLTLRNIPDNFNLNQIRRFIFDKCGLGDVILDGFRTEGDGKRVTVGLVNESQAALFMARINGLYIDGKCLIVEDIRQQLVQPQNSNKRQFYDTKMMAPPMPYQSNPVTYPTAPAPPYSFNNMPFYMAPTVGNYNYGSFGSGVPPAPNVQYPGSLGQNFGPKPWEIPNMPNQSYQKTITNSNNIEYPMLQSHSETSTSANYGQDYSRRESNTKSTDSSNRNSLSYDFNKTVGPKGNNRDAVVNTFQSGNTRWDQQNKLREDIRKSPNRRRTEYSPPRERKFGRESDRDRDSKRNLVYKADRDVNLDRKHNLDYNNDRNRDHNDDRYRRVQNIDRAPKRDHSRENYNASLYNDKRDRNSKWHPEIKREIDTNQYGYSEPTPLAHESKPPSFNIGSNYNNGNNAPESGPSARKRNRFKKNCSDQLINAVYDPKKSNYYKALNLQMDKTNVTVLDKTHPNNANIFVAVKKEPLPQNENKWTKRMKSVLAKVSHRIIQEVNAAGNVTVLIKPLFFKLKLKIRERVREIIKKTKNLDTTNIYDLYRDQFPKCDDLIFLNALKRDRRPINKFQKDIAVLRKAKKVLAGELPAQKKASKASQNKVVPPQVPANPPPPPDSARPPKCPTSDKQIHKQKKKEREAVKDEYVLPIEEKYKTIIDDEVKVIKDLFISACAPDNSDDDNDDNSDDMKTICNTIAKAPADTFAKVFFMQLSERLSKNQSPRVRIFYGRKRPTRLLIDEFLKDYGVVKLRKNANKNMLMATCNSYDGFDRLHALREWNLNGILLLFKPLFDFELAEKTQIKTTQNRTQQEVNDFIQDLKDVTQSLEEDFEDKPAVKLEMQMGDIDVDTGCTVIAAEEDTINVPLDADDLEDF